VCGSEDVTQYSYQLLSQLTSCFVTSKIIQRLNFPKLQTHTDRRFSAKHRSAVFRQTLPLTHQRIDHFRYARFAEDVRTSGDDGDGQRFEADAAFLNRPGVEQHHQLRNQRFRFVLRSLRSCEEIAEASESFEAREEKKVFEVQG